MMRSVMVMRMARVRVGTGVLRGLSTALESQVSSLKTENEKLKERLDKLENQDKDLFDWLHGATGLRELMNREGSALSHDSKEAVEKVSSLHSFE